MPSDTVPPTTRAGYSVSAPADVIGPSLTERARALMAAHEACAGDDVQQLLLREVMGHYRTWCLRRGHGDPFVGPAAGVESWQPVRPQPRAAARAD